MATPLNAGVYPDEAQDAALNTAVRGTERRKEYTETGSST
jgi:hypothetical protein